MIKGACLRVHPFCGCQSVLKVIFWRTNASILEPTIERCGFHHFSLSLCRWPCSCFVQLIALIKHFPHENQQKTKKEPTSNTKATIFSTIVCKKKKKREINQPTFRARIKGSGAFCCGRPSGGVKEGVGFRVCGIWC